MNAAGGTSPASDRIIVALDVSTKTEALHLVDELKDCISLFKIGLQLYTAAGPEIIDEVIRRGSHVFLDLKFHDIPNTVAGAVRSAATLGVRMLTIHLSGGGEMIEAAVRAKGQGTIVLGVTVLTSSTDFTLKEIGVPAEMKDQVRRLAELAAAHGTDGVVASPHEVEGLRALLGRSQIIVTPGVRPTGTDPGDQKRFMTPRDAVAAGADYLVIGRPITAASDPRAAVQGILNELS